MIAREGKAQSSDVGKSQQQVELGLHGSSDVGTKQKGKLGLPRDGSLPSTFPLWWLPVRSVYTTVYFSLGGREQKRIQGWKRIVLVTICAMCARPEFYKVSEAS